MIKLHLLTLDIWSCLLSDLHLFSHSKVLKTAPFHNEMVGIAIQAFAGSLSTFQPLHGAFISLTLQEAKT